MSLHNHYKSAWEFEQKYSLYDPLEPCFQTMSIEKQQVTFGSKKAEKPESTSSSTSTPSFIPPQESVLMKTIREIRERMARTVQSLPQVTVAKAQDFIDTLKRKERQMETLKTQSNELAQKLNDTIMTKQYQTAFYRLPVVMKKVRASEYTTPPDGLYYTNNKGHKTYLKEYQKRQWLEGKLPGCIEGCDQNALEQRT